MHSNGGGESSNKLKGISKSQTKNIRFEEYCNCLFGGDYQKECDNFVIRSLNHDIFLQKVTKISLSAFDEKRCYLRNRGCNRIPITRVAFVQLTGIN